MTESHNLSRLDRDLIEQLQPLTAADLTVYYPFFANTFPLAMHLSQALSLARGKGHPVQARAEQIPWSTPIQQLLGPIPSENGAAVFYATEGDVSRLPGLFQHSVGIYQPRSMFLDRTLLAESVARRADKKIEYLNLSKLLAGRTYVDVHSDIPAQAVAILAAHGLTQEQTLRFPGSDLRHAGTEMKPLEDDSLRHLSDSIRLYIYGGPLTAYLRRKSRRFIEIRIPPSTARGHVSEFGTVVCTNSQSEDVQRALKHYHERLFSAAAHEAPDEFWAVCTAYNRRSRAQLHRSSFLSAREFIKCLNEHSNDDRPTATLAASRPTNQPTTVASEAPLPIVLLGCGKLAIGLVLPSIRDNVPVLVVQVNRPAREVDWTRLSRRNTVRLRSAASPESTFYDQQFDVVGADRVLNGGVQWSSTRRALVIVKDWDEALRIADVGRIVVTALGDGLAEFGAAASRQALSGARKTLLLFENSVDALAGVKAVDQRYERHHVLCDRICSSRTEDPDGRTITVSSELYGELIVPSGFAALFKEDAALSAFAGSASDLGPGGDWSETASDLRQTVAIATVIRTIDGEFQEELYHRRKRWLMNSIQYALALLTVESFFGLGLKLEENNKMPVFLAEALLDRAGSRGLALCIEVLVHCQIGRMLLEPSNKGDSEDPLVKRVMVDASPLAIYENLRLFVDVNRRRIGAVSDAIDRLVAIKVRKNPFDRGSATERKNERKELEERIRKDMKRFLEHIYEPFEFFADGTAVPALRALDVPFPFSQDDIRMAETSIKAAQPRVLQHLIGA